LRCDATCGFDTSSCVRYEHCGNGIDDDENGAVDCADDACFDTAACPRCGDLRVNGQEECDGPDLGQASCASRGFASGQLACTSSCTFDESLCTRPEACTNALDDDRDGLVDCDDPDCESEFSCPVCGNGVVQLGEECDGPPSSSCVTLGFDTGSISCDASCRLDLTECRDFACGDGVAEGLERCDDGNEQTGDGCTPACELEGDVCAAPATLAWDPAQEAWTWSADLTRYFFDYPSACGYSGYSSDVVVSFAPPANGRYYATVDGAFDAVLWASGHPCASGSLVCADDGAAGEGETIELDLAAGETTFFFVAETAGSSNAGPFVLRVGEAICGNGRLEGLEQCDDGNTAPADGCDGQCRFEGDSCADAFGLNAYGSYASWNDLPFTIGPANRVAAGPMWAWAASTELFQPNYSSSGQFGPTPGADGVARFIAPADGTYVFSLYATWDAMLFVWGGACGPGASTEVTGYGLDGWTPPPGYASQMALVNVQLAAGEEIFLVVDGYSGATGDFWLLAATAGVCGDGQPTMDERCDDGNLSPGDGCSPTCEHENVEVEPNGSFASAGPLAVGSYGYGSLDLFDVADLWSFTAEAGETYEIATTHTAPLNFDCSRGAPDTRLRLLDASGALLAENDDVDGSTPCSRIEWTAPASGIYFVEATLSAFHPLVIDSYPLSAGSNAYLLSIRPVVP